MDGEVVLVLCRDDIGRVFMDGEVVLVLYRDDITPWSVQG